MYTSVTLRPLSLGTEITKFAFDGQRGEIKEN